VSAVEGASAAILAIAASGAAKAPRDFDNLLVRLIAHPLHRAHARSPSPASQGRMDGAALPPPIDRLGVRRRSAKSAVDLMKASCFSRLRDYEITGITVTVHLIGLRITVDYGLR